MWHSRLRIYIPLGADIYIADLTEGAKWFVITLIKIVLQYVILYYRFSLLHIFALVLQPWMSAYSENRKGIYFSPQKRFKHGRENITLHWINCIIYRIINVFLPNYMLFLYSKRLHGHTHITTVNSVTNTWSIQQTPTFHGCTITNKQNVEPWKLSTSWGHTKVLFTCS